MKINFAISIIKDLSIHKQANEPLKDQLSKIFVPTLFGKSIVMRNSLRGRVAEFLSKRDGAKTQNEKIMHVFAEALKTLETDTASLDGLTSTVLELDQTLKNEGFRTHTYALTEGTEIPAEVEIEELNKAANKKAPIEKLRLLENSLLHRDTTAIRKGYVSDDAFLAIMKGQYHHEAFAYLLSFLGAHKDSVKEDHRQILERICLSRLENEENVKKSEDWHELSKKYADQLKNLSPGDKWMFFGGYGQKVGSINSLFRALKLLPDSVKKGLPDPIFTLLDADKLPDPVEFAKNEIHSAFTEHFPLFSSKNIQSDNAETAVDEPEAVNDGTEKFEANLQKVLNHKLATPLFEDDNRKLPRLLANILPEIIAQPLEKWAQEGILKQIAAFITDEGLSTIIEEIGSNRSNFLDKEKREEAVISLENKIAQELRAPVNEVVEKADASLLVFMREFQKNIPPALLNALGLDSLFSSGDLWIDFIKEKNGTYTMLVHSSGPALEYHCENAAGRVQWPLRYENINPEKLNEHFFQRLIHHAYDPLKNPESNSRAEHIFKGVFESLDVKPLLQDQDTLNGAYAIKGELSIALASAIKNETPFDLFSFQMKIDALVNYCRPNMSEADLLEINDSETAKKLETAMQVIWEEAQSLQPFLGPAMKDIEATRDEITQALAKFKESEAGHSIVLPNRELVIPKPLLKKFQEVLARNGLSTKSIADIKGALCWAFGEELEEVIDTLVESLELMPKADIPLAPRTGKQGVLKKTITALWTNVYVNVLCKTLQGAWFVRKLYTGQTTGFLLATWLHWGLKKVLPKPYYDWYMVVVDTMMAEIVKGILWVILRVMLSKDKLNELISFCKKTHHTLKNWTHSLNSTQRIELSYENKIAAERLFKIPKGESSLFIANTSVNNSAEIRKQFKELPFPNLDSSEIYGEYIDNPSASRWKNLQELPFAQDVDLSPNSSESLYELSIPNADFEDIADVNRHLALCKNLLDQKPLLEMTLEDYLYLIGVAEHIAGPNSDLWKTEDSKIANRLVEGLSELAVGLHNCLAIVSQHPELTSRAVIAMYGTLAVSDRLARQCSNIGLDGYSINAYPFLAFIKGHGVTISDPKLQQRVNEICGYLMPKVKLDKLPDDPYSDPEIKKAAELSLFNYSNLRSLKNILYTKNVSIKQVLSTFLPESEILDKFFSAGKSWFEYTGVNQLSSVLPNGSSISSFIKKLFSNVMPEACYLSSILEHEHIEKKLLDIGVPKDSFFRTKLNVLFNETLVFGRASPIVPRAFSNLKLHTLLANQMVVQIGTGAPLTPCSIKKAFTPVPSKEDYKDGKYLKSIFREGYERLIHKPANHGIVTATPAKNNVFYSSPDISNAFKTGAKTQSEIVSSTEKRMPANALDASKEIEISKAIEAIFVERDDQALRLIGFIKKYGPDLADDKKLEELFDSALFTYGVLIKQLVRAPQTANALTATLKEQFERCFNAGQFNKCLWLMKTAMKIQKFIPGNHPIFPNARELLAEIIKSQEDPFSPHVSTALQLVALTYPAPSKKLSNKKEAIYALVKAMFYPKIKDSSTAMLPEFIERYGKWMSDILEFAQDENNAREMCDHIFMERGYLYRFEDHQPVWEKDNTLCIGDLQFNFKTGSIEGPEEFLLDNFLRIRKIAKDVVPDLSGFLWTTDGYVNPESTIIVNADLKKQKLIIQRNFSEEKYDHLAKNARGRFYLYTQTKLPNTLLPLADFDEKELAEARCWIENTLSEQKKMVIEFPSKPAKVINLKTVADGMSYEFDHFEFESDQFKPIATSKFILNILPIKSFCSSSHIIGWAKENTKRLDSLYLKPYKLLFRSNAKGSDARLKCVSHYPNYHIASKQLHTSMHGFGSYLLLENDNKDKKALIPEEQWLPSSFAPVLSKLGVQGSLARAAEHWIGSQQQKRFGEPENFFAYDIDKDGSLYSEDPKALLYLLCLYLLQGKNSHAEKTCNELLRIISLQRAPIERLSRYLNILSVVPANLSHVSRIRRSIFAALQLNYNLYSKETDNSRNERLREEDLNKIRLENMVLINACLSDLIANSKETQSRFRLTEDNEWLLYECLFKHIKVLTENGLELPDHIVKNLDMFGWDTIMLSLGFSPELAQRYTCLRKKRKKDNSISNKAFRIIASAFRQKTEIPGMKYASSGMTIFKDILSLAKSLAGSMFFETKSLSIEALSNDISPEIVEIDLKGTTLDEATFTTQFASLYNLALGSGSEAQIQELDYWLAMHKGGWSAQSSLLVQYLTAVRKAPFIFPSINKFKEALKTEQGAQRHKKLLKFMKLIAFRASYSSYFNSIRNLGYHIAYDRAIAMVKPAFFNWAKTGAKAAANVTKAVYSELTFDLEKQSTPAPISVDYKSFGNIDHFVDSNLDEIFEKCFNEVIVNGSQTKHELRSERNLWNLFLSLSGFKDFIEKRAQEQLNSILHIINSNITKDKATFEDIKKALIQDKLHIFCRDLGIKPEEAKLIEIASMRYCVLQTRVNQLQRALGLFSKLTSINEKSDPAKYLDTLNCLIKEIRARRQYDFEKLSPRLLRRYVFFEMLTNTMLWLKQVDPISKVLASDDGDYMIVLLMAMGKTFFGLPTMGSYKADGKNIVFHTSPDTLSETSARQISRQGNLIYNQSTNVFPVNRTTQRDLRLLGEINNLLGKAMTEKETINLVMREGQALEANLIDLLYLAHRTDKDDPEIFMSQQLHKSALQAIRENGILIGDEGHILNQPDKELNHPLGRSYTIKKSYQLIVAICFRELVKNQTFLKAIQENNLKRLSKNDYASAAAAAAKEMSGLWIFNLKPEEKDDFINFVTGNAASIPEWITKSDKYDEICMVKGTLSTLIPILFEQNVNRDYGRSKNKYAGPYAGNMNPNENFDIQLCYENLIKTYSTYLHTGLEYEEAEQLLNKLFDVAATEQAKRNIDFKNTVAYSLLTKMLPLEFHGKIHPGSSPAMKKVAIEALRKNPEAAISYIRFFVSDTIRYWKRCNMTDAQNFFSMFKNKITTTGTNYNEGSNPPKMQLVKQSDIDSECKRLLEEKCGNQDIHTLKAEKPLEILDEILNAYFIKNTFSMLLDGDAQLKGLDNETVARAMEKHCKTHRPDIKAIVYYTRLNGKDQLVCKEIDAHEAYPFDQCKISPQNYLTYIDENHDFGTNVPQSGSMFLLYGEQPLYKLYQQAFRLRDLIKSSSLFYSGKFLEMAKKSADKEQRIHIGLTKHHCARITKAQQGTPTLQQILLDAKTNQDDKVLKENYHSYLKKLRNIARRAIMDKIERANSSGEMHDLYVPFEDFLAPLIPHEPSKLFGLLETEIDTLDALKIERDNIYKVIEQAYLWSNNVRAPIFNEAERAKILDELNILEIPAVPQKTRVFTDGKKIYTDTQNSLKSVMTVERSIDQNIHVQTNVNVKSYEVPPGNFIETEWQKDGDYSDLKWLMFRSAANSNILKKLADQGVTLFKSFWRSKQEIICPQFFRFRSGLKHSSHETVQALSKLVDKQLWFTNNFVPRVLRGIMGEPIDVGSKYQRELYQVLVIYEKSGESLTVKSVGALSQKDAAFWREHLESSNKKMQIAVYDIPNRSVVSGDTTVENLLKNDKNFLTLEVQLKFLNGDVSFDQDQLQILKEWLQNNIAHIDRIYDAYHLIHDQRTTGSTTGTDIEGIFNELRKVPPEYQF